MIHRDMPYIDSLIAAMCRAVDQPNAAEQAIALDQSLARSGWAIVPAVEWQPIKTAPKDETRVLGWDGKYQFVMYWRGADHQPHQDKPGWHEQIYRRDPSHWQPLPAPPVPT